MIPNLSHVIWLIWMGSFDWLSWTGVKWHYSTLGITIFYTKYILKEGQKHRAKKERGSFKHTKCSPEIYLSPAKSASPSSKRNSQEGGKKRGKGWLSNGISKPNQTRLLILEKFHNLSLSDRKSIPPPERKINSYWPSPALHNCDKALGWASESMRLWTWYQDLR